MAKKKDPKKYTTEIEPIAEKMKNSVVIPKEKRQSAFLAAFAETGTVKGAARATGIDKSVHYRWLKNDEEYKATWEEAQEMAADMLEHEAIQRATFGTQVEQWYQGEMVGYRTTPPSDILLIFLLKGLRPDKYRDNYKTELAGPGGAPIEVTFGRGRDLDPKKEKH